MSCHVMVMNLDTVHTFLFQQEREISLLQDLLSGIHTNSKMHRRVCLVSRNRRNRDNIYTVYIMI